MTAGDDTYLVSGYSHYKFNESGSRLQDIDRLLRDHRELTDFQVQKPLRLEMKRWKMTLRSLDDGVIRFSLPYRDVVPFVEHNAGSNRVVYFTCGDSRDTDGHCIHAGSDVGKILLKILRKKVSR